MNLRFLLLLISFIVRSVQSIPVDLIVEKQTDNYEINTENDTEYDLTSCQNGGTESLTGDWCTCEQNFTGRYCEVIIEPQNKDGCGTMFDGEEDYLDCAHCKCTKNWLQCSARQCVNINDEVNTNGSAETVPKDFNIADLVTYMEKIESLAYKYYVNSLKLNSSYELIYKDVNSNTTVSRTPNNIDNLNNQELNNRTKVVVFKSSPTKLIGLYFVPPVNNVNNTFVNTLWNNSLNCSINLQSNVFISLFLSTFCYVTFLYF